MNFELKKKVLFVISHQNSSSLLLKVRFRMADPGIEALRRLVSLYHGCPLQQISPRAHGTEESVKQECTENVNCPCEDGAPLAQPFRIALIAEGGCGRFCDAHVYVL